MKYSFLWSTPNARAPIITIAPYGITFNSATVELLGKPKRLMIGYDEKSKVVGMKPINDDANSKSFEFIKKERNGYVRIGNKDFIKYLINKKEIDFKIRNTYKYIADWDSDDELLIIDLTNPMDDFDSSNDTESDDD
ncbi:MAG TPA: hypothetical protein VEB00_05150 [Clostridia bacterium]|nr:hypothetical protein [Clostridia bacterium]